MKFKSSIIVNAGDVSAQITSTVIDMRFEYGLCYVATFTGAPSGAVLVEGSIDQATWVQIDSKTISGTTPTSANLDAQYWPYMRISKAAGGTGSMTVKVCPKGA